MKRFSIFLVVAVSVFGQLVSSSASPDPSEPPMPPEWQDMSTSIETFAGRVNSCEKEGYSWRRERGPDFEVIRFSNGNPDSSSAGFYLGDHPSASLAVKPEDLGTKQGELNDRFALWVIRPSGHDTGVKLETLMDVKVVGANRNLKLHFWLIVKDKKAINDWLDWAECFQFQLPDN